MSASSVMLYVLINYIFEDKNILNEIEDIHDSKYIDLIK